jgi:chromosome partitioning protein
MMHASFDAGGTAIRKYRRKAIGIAQSRRHREYLGPVPIVTVAASKGGVGKTTLAYELAGALDGILVDLDWDSGGATRMWGYDPSAFRTAPLLDALEAGSSGKPPRPRSRPHQPALVPASRDLAASTIPDALVADCLAAWGNSWGDRFMVVDTHPGANALTDGAMQVADLIVVPVILAAREMDALAGMLQDFADYHLLLVPNMVPPSPPRRFVERLAELANGTPVTPPISEHRWLRRRVRRAAVTLQPNPGKALTRAAGEYREVASAVRNACG